MYIIVKIVPDQLVTVSTCVDGRQVEGGGGGGAREPNAPLYLPIDSFRQSYNPLLHSDVFPLPLYIT